MRSNSFRVVGILLMFGFASFTLSAQPISTDTAERLRKLEQRLDELQRENDALRGELNALKQDLGPQPEVASTEVEDLTAVATTATPVIDVVQNQPAPGAGKVFNPDIAAIGNFVSKMGDLNEFDERASASLEESELSFQAWVDRTRRQSSSWPLVPRGRRSRRDTSTSSRCRTT